MLYGHSYFGVGKLVANNGEVIIIDFKHYGIKEVPVANVQPTQAGYGDLWFY